MNTIINKSRRYCIEYNARLMLHENKNQIDILTVHGIFSWVLIDGYAERSEKTILGNNTSKNEMLWDRIENYILT